MKISLARVNFSTDLLQKIYTAGLCILVVALCYYQIINGQYYFERAKNNYLRVIPSRSMRGAIFDRKRICLAYDKATFNISILPYQIRYKKDSLFYALSKFLGCNINLIYKNYAHNLGGQFSPVDIIVDIDKPTALRLKENFGEDILINHQPQRYYAYPYQCAHLLGYVKTAASSSKIMEQYGYSPSERVGFSGIEQYYDSYLKGNDGGDLIEVDVTGKMVGFLGKNIPKRGSDIELTIDIRMQEIAQTSMEGKKGVLILMNSRSGEILTAYSSPSFDPNNFAKGLGVREVLNDKNSPLMNRITQATYPIGSAFKPILGAGALAEGKISPSTTFVCNGELKVGPAYFRCWSTHGPQDLYQAFAHSCNVYFYQVGLLLGPEEISRWAKKFSLDVPTHIDLPSEKRGFVPSLKWKQRTLKASWFAGDTLNFAIGQGFMVTTPIAIMSAINVFATDGYLVRPYILKKIGVVNAAILNKTYLDIPDKALQIVKKGLREVVRSESGTAHILEKLNLGIAGKTGTAQTSGKSHGWFVGFFTYKGETYTICALAEHGDSSYEAVKMAYRLLKDTTEADLF